MTDIAAAVTVLLGHCVAAGATLRVPITDVARGNPIPGGRCIRVWYGGEDDAPGFPGGSVLDSDLVGETFHITAFFPAQGASGTTVAGDMDADIYALKHQLRSRILGDSQLGGNVTTLALPAMTADAWDLIDGSQVRTLEASVTLSFTEYATNP